MSDLERVVATLVRNIESRFPQYLAAPFLIQEIHEHLIPYRLNRRELGVETNEYYELALTRLLAGEGGYLLVPDQVRGALRAELESPNPDSSRFRAFGAVEVKLTELAHAVATVTPPSAPALVPRAAATDKQSAGAAASAPAAAGKRAADGAAGAAGAAGAKPASTAAAPSSAATTAPATAPAPATATSPAATTSTARAPRSATKAPPQENRMPPAQRTTNAAAVGGKCRYCHGGLPEGRDLTYCPHCGQDLTIQHCPACSTELELGWKFCITCGRSVAA